MSPTAYQLTLALTRSYLEKKLHLAENEIAESVTSDAHTQWQVRHLAITISRISDDVSIINIVRDKDVRAVQIDLKALNNESAPKEISPSLEGAFTAHMDQSLRDSPLLHNPNSLESNQRATADTSHNSEDPTISRSVPSAATGFDNTSVTRSRPPDMPDFDDEYELKTRHRQSLRAPTLGIGDSDLNPPGLPRNPEMKPYLDPAGGGTLGGMHPTADHPLFGHHEGNTSRIGVPPGARFEDPYGEDNLEDMGMGLPGNLRRLGGSGSGCSNFRFGGNGSFGSSDYGGNGSFGGPFI